MCEIESWVFISICQTWHLMIRDQVACLQCPVHEEAEKVQIQRAWESEFSVLHTLGRTVVCMGFLYIRTCKWQMGVTTGRGRRIRGMLPCCEGPIKIMA